MDFKSDNADTGKPPGEVASLLLDWYNRHARQLPWRDRPEPYRIWISEIMLQQTRVETAQPYFERWMALFPDVESLARASEQQVLHAWEGLGYYSRARNLHKAAQQVMEHHAGRIPTNRTELEKLPGIGRYTAGAIASIAFGKDEVALDGNIRRVLARIYNVDIPARSPAGERRLWDLAEKLLPVGRAGDFNQAMMDLGSSICTPHTPACLACPIASACQAYALGLQEARPVLETHPPVPHYLVTAAVIYRDGQVLIARRPSHGLLGGMWEFPGGKVEQGEELAECLAREILEELGVQIQVDDHIGIFRHAYTHFKVTLHAFFCSLKSGTPQALHASEIRWITPSEVDNFPMGKIDRMISRSLQESPKR